MPVLPKGPFIVPGPSRNRKVSLRSCKTLLLCAYLLPPLVSAQKCTIGKDQKGICCVDRILQVRKAAGAAPIT